MHLARPDARAIAEELRELSSSHARDPARVARVMAEVDALLAAHQDRIYAMCYRFLGEPEQASEVAQDVMLRAFQKLPGFRGESRFSTWVLGIARYECLNARRRRRDEISDDGLLEPTDPQRSVLSSLRTREREDLFRAAASAALDPVEQEAVALRYVEHLPVDEITRLLDLPDKSGARGLLQRCKRKLQRELRRRLAELGHGSSFVRGSFE